MSQYLCYGLGIVSVILLLNIFCRTSALWTAFQKLLPVSQRKTINNLPTAADGKDYISSGKTDERSLEVGDIEIVASSIDEKNQKFYQNLGNKAKQDEAVRLLFKAARKNQENKQQGMCNRHQQQEQRKQTEKDLENKRQLQKLRGFKIKEKVAKKVAQKNIQLDDEQIKKIKLKALGNKTK